MLLDVVTAVARLVGFSWLASALLSVASLPAYVRPLQHPLYWPPGQAYEIDLLLFVAALAIEFLFGTALIVYARRIARFCCAGLDGGSDGDGGGAFDNNEPQSPHAVVEQIKRLPTEQKTGL